MKSLPIRWKFALSAAALVGVVLALFSGGTYHHLYQEQIEEVDLTIESAHRHLAALDDQHFADRSFDELLRFQPWMALAIFDAAGHLQRSSASLPESVARTALTGDAIQSSRDPAGETWRLKPLRRGGRIIVVGHTLAEVNEIIRDLFVGYALSLPVVLVVAALGGWWVSGRALAPLRALATAAENVRADQLDRRVPVVAANDEIRRLADVLNAMLARLESSFQQAQRFAADASHELRTPLTIMQGEIERLLRSPDPDRLPESRLLSLQEEIARLDRITEQLLLLAQFDAGRTAPAARPVDLSALVRETVEDAWVLADARQVTMTSDLAGGLRVTGNGEHLRRALLTLLDNATRYNVPGGRVLCTLAGKGDHAELRVGNTGPGIPVASRGQLFHRFFRADPARSRGGHGLGLSLAREIARAHGGTLELEAATPDGWTGFVLTLPLVTTAVVA